MFVLELFVVAIMMGDNETHPFKNFEDNRIGFSNEITAENLLTPKT